MTETTEREAAFIRAMTGEFVGQAYLFRLSSPLTWVEPTRLGPKVFATDYVVVSAVGGWCGSEETCIFPSDDEGRITTWYELDGSYRGGLSHREALDGAGYTVVDVPDWIEV